MQTHSVLSKSSFRVYLTTVLLIAASSFLSGCSSTGEIPNHERNQFVTVFYATVADVSPIRFESYAEEAAAMGAVDGALWNFGEDEMLFSALFGAVFSGMAASIMEGDLNGLEVGLQAIDGDYVIVTTEQDDVSLGDCVRVRVGAEVQLFNVHPDYCNSAY